MSNCLHCGEVLTKRVGTKFCSKICSNKFAWADKKKPRTIKKNCPACGTEFEGSFRKFYCSPKCQKQKMEQKVKDEKIEANKKFIQHSRFKEFTADENDNRDFVLRDLINNETKIANLRKAMDKRGIVARPRERERRTRRGIFIIKVNLVSAGEFVKLYNILIEEFLKKPTIPKKLFIEDIGKMIERIRKIGD